MVSTAPTDEPPPTDEVIAARSAYIVALNDKHAHAALMRARRALLVSDAEAMQSVWPALALEVVPGATHPTMHPRALPRRPEFLAAIRRWIAK